LTVHFDHAGIAGLDRPELRVITDVRDRPAYTGDHVDKGLVLAGIPRDAVDGQLHDGVSLLIVHLLSSRQMKAIAAPSPS